MAVVSHNNENFHHLFDAYRMLRAGGAIQQAEPRGVMPENKSKHVCECKICGNEAEMEVTCSLEFVEDTLNVVSEDEGRIQGDPAECGRRNKNRNTHLGQCIGLHARTGGFWSPVAWFVCSPSGFTRSTGTHVRSVTATPIISDSRNAGPALPEGPGGRD
jgi:hypothetical protein